MEELLKTGVFGVMSDGKKFVVVEDYIVYQDGGFDAVATFDRHSQPLYWVEKLVKCKSFKQLESVIENRGNYPIIYEGKKKEPQTFKVVCAGYKQDRERYFTVGKIYTWDHGKLVCDDGFVFRNMVEGTDPDEWKLSRSYKFIKIVEEKEGK